MGWVASGPVVTEVAGLNDTWGCPPITLIRLIRGFQYQLSKTNTAHRILRMGGLRRDDSLNEPITIVYSVRGAMSLNECSTSVQTRCRVLLILLYGCFGVYIYISPPRGCIAPIWSMPVEEFETIFQYRLLWLGHLRCRARIAVPAIAAKSTSRERNVNFLIAELTPQNITVHVYNYLSGRFICFFHNPEAGRAATILVTRRTFWVV